MKLIYWGVDKDVVERKYGPTPILVTDANVKQLRDDITKNHNVKAAIIKDEVKCPHCGTINEFDVIRSFNFGIESVCCLSCDTDFCNYMCGELTEISQEDWDTIVFGLCPLK